MRARKLLRLFCHFYFLCMNQICFSKFFLYILRFLAVKDKLKTFHFNVKINEDILFQMWRHLKILSGIPGFELGNFTEFLTAAGASNQRKPHVIKSKTVKKTILCLSAPVKKLEKIIRVLKENIYNFLVLWVQP